MGRLYSYYHLIIICPLYDLDAMYLVAMHSDEPVICVTT